ncbi:MAG: nickel-responsive transcriptional regulator NikR [Deltaproteobacteria bacterium]|nr:nickel-responsive transcriptional regulator NikR [Deltaproteobacteria bacterium]
MERLIRFGVSMPERLLRKFDKYIRERKYGNRSEAIRDIVREKFVEESWERGKGEEVGVIVIVYDHEVRELSARLNEIQHDNFGHIIASMHVHLDEHNCLEIITIRGFPDQIKKTADALISIKGVKHGRLVHSTTGKNLE